MKSIKNKHAKKNGAALVIAIGFLAILTIIIVAFTVQTRTERLTGQGFLVKAQTRQLLNSSLSRAMDDIDLAVSGKAYPPFMAIASQGTQNQTMSLDLALEEAYIPDSGSPLYNTYQTVLQSAQWEMVSSANSNAIGRIGYVILNTSGLLDANHSGGYTELADRIDYAERQRGTAASELQLSHELLDEFTDPDTSSLGFPGISLDEQGELESQIVHATNPELSPALAMVHNRKNAWRKFETLRDFHELNLLEDFNKGIEDILSGPPINFRTFSLFLEEPNEKQYMGSSTATLQEGAIRTALGEVDIIGEDQDFVVQQIKDYVDSDSTVDNPTYSIEPVPLINELILICDFQFTPVIEEEPVDPEDPDGDITNFVSAVLVTNIYSLEVEAWFPFINARNDGQFSIQIDRVESDLPEEIFGDISSDWSDIDTSIGTGWQYNTLETSFLVENIIAMGEYDAASLNTAFDFSSTLTIDQITLSCIESPSITVDLAENLELPVGEANSILASNVAGMIEFFFNNSDAADFEGMTNFTYSIGAATIDPRLNWDGLNNNHWVETGANNYENSMGEINQEIIDELVGSPEDEPKDKIYIRNENEINSPYEFTYLLPSINQPWNTFQFYPENNADQTYRIAELLATDPKTRIKQGLVNPNTTITNVLATAFLNMPIDEFVTADLSITRRLDSDEAVLVADMVMENRPYSSCIDIIENLSYDAVSGIINGNTWENESLLRNSMGLLNTRDSTFTIILAAQKGMDSNNDNVISNEEVQSTQKAVAYVWRDPVTGKSACVFWGLSDTLQSSISGNQDWGDILGAFKPSP